MNNEATQGMVYNIQRMSTKDGPGIRTTVFLKGCPLRCLWCSNPESQRFSAQTLFFQDLCTHCGSCASVCPNGAAMYHNAIKRQALCSHCGACVAICPTKACEISGKMMTIDEVMRIVRKDAMFYHNSGGGVTFGGGEPTSGGAFFLELLQAAYDEGLHTAVDTCGFCPEERFSTVLKYANLLLFDCKHMDNEQHKVLSGVENVGILRNMQEALQSSVDVIVRMPLIPQHNDSEENIAAMASFFIPLGKRDIEVMPYHTFGRSKYSALGKVYPTFSSYTQEELQKVLNTFTKYGLNALVAH